MSNDPQRFRTVMPVTWLEMSWGMISVVLYLENRILSQVLAPGSIDLLFAALFVCAYVTATQSRALIPASSDRSNQ